MVRPLEESLGTIPGITVLTATANANSGNVSIEFNEAADMDLMVVEARDRVDRVRHLLPDDIERINIRRFQSSDIPILQFHLGLPGNGNASSTSPKTSCSPGSSGLKALPAWTSGVSGGGNCG